MKYFSLLGLFAFLLAPIGLASASVTPTMSLAVTGSGDNVQVTVHGDPNASVLLSYSKAGAGPTIESLGYTDSNGNLSNTISSAVYGLTSGTLVTAFTGGTSGPRSAELTWPTVTSSNSLKLSQRGLVVNAGSSASIIATGGGGSALYVSGNSNPSIANVSISGTQITISGNVSGSTTVTICTVGTSSNCPTVSVLIMPSGSASLSFSQTSPTVVKGQNLPITLSGGNGSFLIDSNSDPSVIQASVSGAVLTLSTGSTEGSSSIIVCSTDRGVCGVIIATAGNSSSVSVSFSSTAPSVAVNQSMTVSVYGPSGVSYYVSSNSNPAIVQANLSGTTLTLTGIAQGSSSVSVCATTNSCATLTATVSSNASNETITLSQKTLSLQAGQSATITVSGGTQPYSITGGASGVTTQSISGTTLTVNGVGSGTAMVWACSAEGGACAGVSVTVSGGSVTYVQPSVSAPVYTPAAPVVSSAETFTSYLKPGLSGAEVLALQKFLAAKGYLTATPNGYFGAQTEKAVRAFQKANKLEQLGVVGPATRAALNKLAGASVSSAGGTSGDISSMTLAELKAEVQTLQARLLLLLARIAELSR